ncbi:DUF397 domain-containing protein [Streptomyces sp. NBC_00243]|uniref:DUF397 domain-containing protein n=1 Tax=Streptomyces sp. NBC_00243 TaxID=2975688 RepID=UPI003FA3A991
MKRGPLFRPHPADASAASSHHLGTASKEYIPPVIRSWRRTPDDPAAEHPVAQEQLQQRHGGVSSWRLAALTRAIAIRDSKAPSGPQLMLSTAACQSFIHALPQKNQEPTS